MSKEASALPPSSRAQEALNLLTTTPMTPRDVEALTEALLSSHKLLKTVDRLQAIMSPADGMEDDWEELKEHAFTLRQNLSSFLPRD